MYRPRWIDVISEHINSLVCVQYLTYYNVYCPVCIGLLELAMTKSSLFLPRQWKTGKIMVFIGSIHNAVTGSDTTETLHKLCN